MPTNEANDLDRLAGELFRLTRLFERARHADGVDRAVYLLLAHLVKSGPTRLSALACAVHSDVSTVSRQVAGLVRLGLVERRPDPTDGRAGVLAATEAGTANVAAKRATHNAAYDEMLDGWSAADRRRLAELLNRFNDDFEHFHLAEIK
jgi:DNA-binding MarR family transcriptional regulator